MKWRTARGDRLPGHAGMQRRPAAQNHDHSSWASPGEAEEQHDAEALRAEKDAIKAAAAVEAEQQPLR
ncbi:hypothetical protein [Pseudarthrobacter sp. NamB4]|uniref:hypothetical protein n=1 Tax=Pseudarthrobacter sp. NamB4 TaxID=2576837 RepID=UPI00197AE42C|nr:hypothetical protein [Pseudarthrobacter sp. NamB4]